MDYPACLIYSQKTKKDDTDPKTQTDSTPPQKVSSWHGTARLRPTQSTQNTR